MRSNRIDEALYGRKYNFLQRAQSPRITVPSGSCGCKDTSLSHDHTRDLRDFLSQFLDISKVNFEVLQMSSDASNGLFSMSIDTKTNGILTIASNTVELKEKGVFLSTVTLSDTTGFERYEVLLRQTGSETFVIEAANVIGGNESGGTGSLRWGWGNRYSACIGRVLDTDNFLGQVITVGALASPVCTACGLASGTIFGFMALGCLAV